MAIVLGALTLTGLVLWTWPSRAPNDGGLLLAEQVAQLAAPADLMDGITPSPEPHTRSENPTALDHESPVVSEQSAPMLATCTLVLAVRTVTGEPVSARVRWSRQPRGTSGAIDSFADPVGLWRAEVPLEGPTSGGSLLVSSDGFDSVAVHLPSLANGTLELGSVELEPARVVRGMVIDQWGVGVQGAHVLPISVGNEAAGGAYSLGFENAVVSDHAGQFGVDQPVAVHGFATHLLAYHPSNGTYGEVRVDRAGGVNEHIEIMLAPAEQLTGRVVDQNAIAVPGANIEASLYPGVLVAQTKADANGRFTLMASPGHELTLSPRAEGYATVKASIATAFAPREGIELILPETCARSLYAIDAATGESIEKFTFELCARALGRSACYSGSAIDSMATLRDVPCGIWSTIEVSAEGYWPASLPGQATSREDLATPLVVSMDPRGDLLEVVGAVERYDGEPAAGAVIHLSKSSVKEPGGMYTVHADEVGRYSIADVPPDRYTLVARDLSGQMSQLIEVTLSDKTFSAPLLVMENTAMIEGRLAAVDQGLMSGAVVSVRPTGPGREYRTGRSVITSSDGSFSFPGLTPGRLILSGWRRHPSSQELLEVPLHAIELVSGERRIIECTLSAPLRLTFAITPRPVRPSGWMVRLQRLTEPETRADWEFQTFENHAASVDARGECAIEGVRPGRFDLRLESATGELLMEQPLVVGGAAQSQRAFVISLGG